MVEINNGFYGNMHCKHTEERGYLDWCTGNHFLRIYEEEWFLEYEWRVFYLSNYITLVSDYTSNCYERCLHPVHPEMEVCWRKELFHFLEREGEKNSHFLKLEIKVTLLSRSRFVGVLEQPLKLLQTAYFASRLETLKSCKKCSSLSW